MEHCFDQIKPSFGCSISFAFESPSKDREKIKFVVISSRIHSKKNSWNIPTVTGLPLYCRLVVLVIVLLIYFIGT